MKYSCLLLIMSIVYSSCQSPADAGFHIQWSDSLKLPALAAGTANPGVAGAYAGITGKYLLIAGGANFPDSLPWQGGKKKYQSLVYVFESRDTGWRFVNSFDLPQPMAYGACVSLLGDLLCFGGENAQGPFRESLQITYDAGTDQLITKPFVALPVALTNSAALVSDGKIYVAGGDLREGVSNKLYMLDIQNEVPHWREQADMPAPVSNFVMAKAGEEIIIAGGRCRQPDGISILYNSVYAYNAEKNAWTEKRALPYALSAAAGIGWGDDRLLIFGGDRGATFHETEKYIQQIKAEKDPDKKALLVDAKNALQASHPGFSNVVLSYSVAHDRWEAADSIPFSTPVTTRALRFGDQVIIPSGEIRAGVRTPNVLIGTVHLK